MTMFPRRVGSTWAGPRTAEMTAAGHRRGRSRRVPARALAGVLAAAVLVLGFAGPVRAEGDPPALNLSSEALQPNSARPPETLTFLGIPSASPLNGEGNWLTGTTSTSSWRSGSSLRLELEYQPRVEAEPLSGLAPLAPQRTVSNLGLSSIGGETTLMANALFDFKLTDWLTPYVGAGLGWAHVRGTDARSGFLDFARGTDVLAVHGLLGVSVPVGDNFSFFADSRLLLSDDFSLVPSVGAPSESSLRDFSTRAGFRYTIGGGK